MEIILVFPPQWQPTNPYPSVPLLVGQLRTAGFNAIGNDLNIGFFYKILNSKYLKKAYVNAVKRKKQLELEIKEKCLFEKHAAQLTKNERISLKAYEIISQYIRNRKSSVTKAIKYIENALSIIKNKKSFYRPESLFRAQVIIDLAIELACLQYAPSKLTFSTYENEEFPLNMKDIIEYCENPQVDMFREFFQEYVKGIDSNVGLICISVPNETQLLATFSLAKVIKENTNIKVCIGGNLITKTKETYVKYKEVFEKFFDYISIGQGEESIVELAQCLKYKKDLSTVSGLLYLHNGKVVENPQVQLRTINEYANFDFAGYDFSKYLTPEIVLPVFAAKGCYWGKCTFCDFCFGKKYQEKNPQKIVTELKDLKEKYGIRSFYLTDEAIKPQYFEKLSKELIKQNININYYAMARFEKEFNQKNLKLMKESGLVSLFWGYESESSKILKEMNKGINPNDRIRILKDSQKAGIWNYVTLVFGFPTETTKDMQATVDAMYKHRNIIDKIIPHSFYVQKNAMLKNHLECFHVSEIEERQEFFSNFVHKTDFFSNEIVAEYIKKCNKHFWQGREKTVPYFLLSNYLFLYLRDKGIKWVKEYNLTV